MTSNTQPHKDLASSTRTERNRADLRKAHGVHFTPPELARFLAEEAITGLGRTPRIVLDPACGGGELLAAVVDILPALSHERLAVHGLEADRGSVRASRDRLSGCRAAIHIEEGDFLESLENSLCLPGLDATANANRLPEADIVIANPPYVRTQTLGKARVARLVEAFKLRGRVDLYQAFVFGMAKLVRPSGVLALLCSNRLLYTRAGESVRALLDDEFEVLRIIDLGDTKLFDAAVLPAILIARRGSAESTPSFLSVYEMAEQQPAIGSAPTYDSVLTGLRAGVDQITSRGIHYEVRRGFLGATDASKPWTLRDDESQAILDRLAARQRLTFGDVGPVRVGIKTTADSVFIRSDWDSLPEDTRPEASLLRPLLTHRDAARWRSQPPTARVLYPHNQVAGRCRPVDLQRFPRAARYLEQHRDRLEGRAYVREAGREWFEIWVPQKPSAWALPKIVFPDIAVEPTLFLDESGAIVNGDCYWMSVGTLDLAYLALAVANSSLALWYYDAVCGNQLYSGRRRYMTQYVKSFPLPDPDSSASQRLMKLAQDRARGFDVENDLDLNDLVWRSFGLEEPAR